MPNVLPKAESLIGYTLDNERLRLVSPLGRGSGGVVFRAVDTVTLEEYAVKCLVKAERGTRQYNFQMRELVYHQAVSGQANIVTLHKVVEQGPYMFLVLDYCSGGDFFKFLTETGVYRRNDRLVKDVFLQLIDAVDACHKKGVFHRDIKPENIMCNKDGTKVWLGDFGLSTDSRWSTNFGAGTAGYMSPECIGEITNQRPYCTRTNDTWALGVILTSLISGHNPWRRAVMTDDCFKAYNHNPSFFRHMLPISEAADNILRRIFVTSPTRISIVKLRRLVQSVDTFFMSDDEIAHASKYVQSSAAHYLFASPTHTSSPPSRYSNSSVGVVRLSPDSSEATQYPDEADIKHPVKVEVNFVSSSARSRNSILYEAVPDARLVTPIKAVASDIESHRTHDLSLRRRVPPPQPMPSFKELMNTSPIDIEASRGRSRSRKNVDSDSSISVLRRIMDRFGFA